MNRSGESIAAISGFFKIEPERILILHDEVELPFGELGLKFGGGLSGHNGLRSAASALGTRNFYRLRIGVGRPAHGSVSSYVLGKFSTDELPELGHIAAAVQEMYESLAVDGAHPSPLLERYRRRLVRRR
jgi:PTH1 family peptidyl-tRNA hydrolase